MDESKQKINCNDKLEIKCCFIVLNVHIFFTTNAINLAYPSSLKSRMELLISLNINCTLRCDGRTNTHKRISVQNAYSVIRTQVISTMKQKILPKVEAFRFSHLHGPMTAVSFFRVKST